MTLPKQFLHNDLKTLTIKQDKISCNGILSFYKMKLLNLNNILRDQPLDKIIETRHYVMTESSISNHHYLISLSSDNFCCNKSASETHSYSNKKIMKVKKSRVKIPTKTSAYLLTVTSNFIIFFLFLTIFIFSHIT